MHRTQIYLDEEQTARLDARAAAEGASRSTLIRRAVDNYLTEDERDATAWRARWKKVVAETAGVAPYLQGGAEYVDELRRADAERLTRLDP